MDPNLMNAMTAAAGVPDPGAVTDESPLGYEGEGGPRIERDPPEPDAARAALVRRWNERVTKAREKWKKLAFDKMRDDMRFASGDQWPSGEDGQFADAKRSRYVANITLRHIAQRTANLYGKNPKVIARRRTRLLNTVWDGRATSLQQALQAVEQSIAVGMMPDPSAVAIIMDAQQVQQQSDLLARIGKTLEVLFEWQLDEQVLPFKQQMKSMIRRSLTTGVGYLKLGFQRAMDLSPEAQRQLADYSERLATIERLGAEIAEGEIDTNAPEMEQLRLAMQALSREEQVIVREGLAIDWPDSWAIIPDANCKQLRGFVGSEWVAEEYLLTAEKIEEIYKVDVCKSATVYDPTSSGTLAEKVEAHFGNTQPGGTEDKTSLFAVWEIYNKTDGLVYVVCDGHKDFLREPAAPDVKLERFWPWFPFMTNELYQEGNPFPPSDVSLIRDPQLEFNRARQGLREHRRANRPKIAVPAGMLDEDDKAKLENHPANAVIELQALQPNQRVEDVLQPVKMPGVDPNLYDTSQAYHDIMSIVGSQEANLGPTSGATATETTIAESSRAAAAGSTVDDLDEFLSEFARAAGQVLLANVQAETVQKIVGPGAVWPQLSMEDIQGEIYLEIEAGSSGRPNRAQEVQNATQLVPILLQIPGLSPEWIARELIRRMDDRLDLTDAFAAGMPSIQQLNRVALAPPGPPVPGNTDPAAQGGHGGDNAPTQPPQVNTAPRPQQAQASASGGMAGGMAGP